MDPATRMRYEMLTSCNRTADRIQLELAEAQNEIRRLAASMRDFGVDADADLKQAVEATDRMAKSLSEKVYGKP